jgi:hypothetical protein
MIYELVSFQDGTATFMNAKNHIWRFTATFDHDADTSFLVVGYFYDIEYIFYKR